MSAVGGWKLMAAPSNWRHPCTCRGCGMSTERDTLVIWESGRDWNIRHGRCILRLADHLLAEVEAAKVAFEDPCDLDLDLTNSAVQMDHRRPQKCWRIGKDTREGAHR